MKSARQAGPPPRLGFASCASILCAVLLALVPAISASAQNPPPARQYAADREVQILHLKLDVTPNFDARSVRAQATLRFQPVFRSLAELRLDARGLRVSQLEASQPVQGYQSTADQLIVTFREPLPPDAPVTVTVAYEVEPREGLYFRTPAMGYREGDTHLFTQGEAILARNWYPCIDEPNAMFTSEMICRVPDGMTVVSNGRLVSEELDAGTGLRSFHWLQEQPHANYLITLVAGYFKKIEDRHGDLPLAFLTPPSEIDQAASSFRNTKDMMQFFEEEIGVPYPWPKYYQICVNDFVAGGMENTSATTLTDGTLFSAESETLRDSDGLVAHELVHQWFGDLVTCKDWSHLWLNEGFATYYESLYQGHQGGRDAMLYDLYQQARVITGPRDDNRAIVRRTYEQPDEMFSYLSYQKGGWVVHMLRSQLGAETYRKCIRTFLERHRHSNVVTEDLRRILEEFTGRTFDRFFDQWVYHGGFPRLELSYAWDQPNGVARVTVRQTQKVTAETLLFHVPLKVRFHGASGSVDREMLVTQTQEDFSFPLTETPQRVRFDPDYELLADIVFTPPGDMLKAQAQDLQDVIGRMLAATEYGKRRDGTAVAALRNMLKTDPFYGVRLQAATGLGGMQTDEAFQALLDSADQPDARVRRRVVEDIGRFYREEACAFALKVIANEKVPDIRATALESLAAYSRPEIKDLLLDQINRASYRNQIGDAAIRAMRSQADPVYLTPILNALKTNPGRFTSHGYGQALGTLAALARPQENKDEVREFLLGHLDDLRRPVRLGAISALGRLRDPKAAAALQKIASGSKQNREAAAAEGALAELRKEGNPVEDLGTLRKEVVDLQNANRELREQLEQFRKRLEALNTSSKPEEPKQPAPPPRPRKPKMLMSPASRD